MPRNNVMNIYWHIRKKLSFLLPRRPFLKATNPAKPKVIVNSFSKSGTHLLGKLVEEMGFVDLPVMLLENNYTDFRIKDDWDKWAPVKSSGVEDFGNPFRIPEPTEITIKRLRNGQFFTSHLKYSQSLGRRIIRLKIKHLFIVRDIRDCIYSWMNWVMDLKSHNHIPKWFFYLNALKSEEQRLLTVIEGKDRFLEPFSDHLDYGWGWLDDPNLLVVRYENLIGPRGGGNRDKQTDEIQKIAKYLGCNLSENNIKEIAGNIWGGRTRTMKYGKSNYWKEKFSNKVMASFNRHYDQYMRKLGY